MSNHKTNNSRRDFLLKSMTLIPAAVIGGSGVGALTAPTPAVAASNTTTQNDYQPTFFTPEEWAFIKAAVARLIPADERGPGALEAGVPEFIDRQMNTPYATGSIWYMQGPFNPDVPKEMGYQLPLVPKQIYNLGISDADAYSKKTAGKPFAELDGAQQDAMLQKFESGEAEFQQLPSKLFFSYLLQNTREGFFSDPIHGGNKDMVGWKLINFPGARADFMDWVERGSVIPSRRSRFVGRGANHGNGNEKVDAVIVGFGWVGAIMAKELTEAGLNVVALERGPMRDTYPDGSYPQVIDELTYNIRRKLFRDLSKSTVTIRHNSSQTAVPYRQLAAFLPGTGVGGAGLHWSGVHFRVDPIELRMRSHYEERYGKNFIPKDMTIQDFGVTYDELEPFFDKAEKVFGTSGTARPSKGRKWRRRAATALRRIAPATSRCRRRKIPTPPSCSKSGAGGGLSPIQPAVRQYLGLLHQPVRRADGPVQLLRFLQRLRLLHVFQSFAERQHSAGAAHGKTLRATHQRQRAEGQPDRRQVPRHRRELRRCAGPRD